MKAHGAFSLLLSFAPVMPLSYYRSAWGIFFLLSDFFPNCLLLHYGIKDLLHHRWFEKRVGGRELAKVVALDCRALYFRDGVFVLFGICTAEEERTFTA